MHATYCPFMGAHAPLWSPTLTSPVLTQWCLQVPVLLLLENAPARMAADIMGQPWFKLYHFVAHCRPDIDLHAFAENGKVLAAQPQGFARQLDAVAALRPNHISPDQWDQMVNGR
jgi:hypothetical protein